MLYVLFLSVVAFAIFIFAVRNRDILSPSLWACIMFALSIFVNILNADRWGSAYSLKAYGLIMLGLFMLFVGESFAKTFRIRKKRPRYAVSALSRQAAYSPIRINAITCAIIIIISLACLVIDVMLMNRISRSGNIFSELTSARSILASGEGSKGFLGRVVLATNRGISYYMIYVILYNMVLCRHKNRIVYYIPIVLFLLQAILTTGRTVFIRIIVYTFFIFVIFYISKYGTKGNKINKIVFIGIGALVVFFVLFTLIGKLLGKGIYNSALDVIYYYSGSSIYLFNQYIASGAQPESAFFGEHTLYGIYNVLHYIFPSIEHVKNPALDFMYIPHWYSNIYTAFRRYYQDFGLAGVIYMPLFLGMFYGYLEKKAKSDLNRRWNTIFYAYSIYPIIEIAIEERFLVNFVSFSTFFEVSVLYILYRFLNKIRFRIGVHR